MADDRRKPCESPSACGGSHRRQSGDRPNKRGRNSKIHLAVDANGMPVRVIITAGTVNDCTKADELTQGLTAECLVADKGYDTNAIVSRAIDASMQVVIPPTERRKVQRDYDKEIYRRRHRVENAFLTLKHWRGIATRYAKNSASFLAAVHFCCIIRWAKVLSLSRVDTI